MNEERRGNDSLFVTLEPLVLASASPRRKALLSSVGLTFEVVPSNSTESELCGAAPSAATQSWAKEKAGLVAESHSGKWVLAADTIVVLGDEILGKPRDANDAAIMLSKLNGRLHRVITGICLIRADRSYERMEAVETEVRFKQLSVAEIEAYVRTREPLDKAGGYGIQGLGAFMVDSICGSYTNVVGLPLCKTLNWLLDQQVIAPRGSE